ncbi:hypothetical Protein YC6258_04598 [Gynuella sunshinyii YC6258]|uniref:Uncharacterized protein n=1 Tax=Gynuella sunshinyii YC6258 TaxID=1445510 RepID=A0A0C5VBA7_9GAMM|nr:hypothetical Protein YC6258_04598 [Gynuella sunshinyii YC6258]
MIKAHVFFCLYCQPLVCFITLSNIAEKFLYICQLMTKNVMSH